MLTAYCLSYGHWTVIPKQWHESFSEMRDMGFDVVALSFSESEMRYSRRAFESQIEYAKKCGLQVFVIPSRIGGRFAGSPLMPSMWLTMHPEYQVPGHPDIACLEAVPFVEWCRDFMATLIRDYDIDGIIWDEPKAVGLISSHPSTLARYGNDLTSETMQDGFVYFLKNLSAFCKELKPQLIMTMFSSATNPEYFTSRATKIRELEYCGYDGNCSKTSYFKEPPAQNKYLLLDVWERTQRECEAAGKKTFGLIENMLIPASENMAYRHGLEEYLSCARPDQLAVYYYAHNNECPEEIHSITKELLKKYWR
jgi:hypothetical protein